MNETLIVTLTATALSGLTFLAYKHPAGYKRIIFIIAPFVLFILFMKLLWNIGGIYAFIDISYNEIQRYPNDLLKDHTFAIEQMFLLKESLKVFLFYFIPILFYLVFLLFLPRLLGLTEPNRPVKKTSLT